MFLVEQSRKFPGEVVVYCGGALTNVALAARMDRGFAARTRGLVVVGGYVDRMVEGATGGRLQADLVSDMRGVFF